jgi:hypothetical protein
MREILIPLVFVGPASGGGCTVGPGCDDCVAGACDDAVCVDGEALDGYFLAALPAAAFPTFEAEEPMLDSIGPALEFLVGGWDVSDVTKLDFLRNWTQGS